MSRYTVKSVARMSGVTVRALHHFDAIGLLKPASIGSNGYRYYGREELLRLQDILFHRALGVPLAEIAAVIGQTGACRIEALKAHRERLAQQAERCRRLIRTIDRTIADLSGTETMTDRDLYQGFEPERQREYERWIADRFGDEGRREIAAGKSRWKRMTDAQQASFLAEIAPIEKGLADALRAGRPANDPANAAWVERHRAWVGRAWGETPNAQRYRGLADLYLAHPDFIGRYESIAPGFADYLADAMRAFAEPQPEP